MSDNTKQLFFKARQTCLEMMKDRGYQIPDSLHINLDQFLLDEHEQYMVMTGITEPTKFPRPVHVVMVNEQKQNDIYKRVHDVCAPPNFIASIKLSIKDRVQAFTSIHSTENPVNPMMRIIVIYNAGSSNSHASLGLTTEKDSLLEFFELRQMTINPKNHIYQPIWRLMKKNEVDDLFQIFENKSARILLGSVCFDDPMNRYYDGRPPCDIKKTGDVYEITRDGVNIFYRKVVMKKINLK